MFDMEIIAADDTGSPRRFDIKINETKKIGKTRAHRFLISGYDITISTSNPDLVCSNSKFLSSIDMTKLICKSFLESGKLSLEQATNVSLMSKLISHNLSEANAKSIQIGSILTTQIGKGYSISLQDLAAWVHNNPTEAAKKILGFYKNSQTIKSELLVVDHLSGQEISQSFMSHSIHKFLMNLSYVFFKSLLDKGISLDIKESPAKAYFDYNSMHVAFFRIFENMEKYVIPNSRIEISTVSNDISLCISIKMTSTALDEDERTLIFNKGYRGRFSINDEGSGIGMWVSKNLIEKNNGSISFIPRGKRFEHSNHLQYQDNEIQIRLKAT